MILSLQWDTSLYTLRDLKWSSIAPLYHSPLKTLLSQKKTNKNKTLLSLPNRRQKTILTLYLKQFQRQKVSRDNSFSLQHKVGMAH